MKFDMLGRISVVLAPVDLRAGYQSLSSIAASILGINVDKGGEFVLFVSRRGNVCKMIWADDRGSSVLTRRLHHGRFERFLAKLEAPAAREITLRDLDFFLDGKPLFLKRAGFFA